MKMTVQQYSDYVEKKTPNSKMGINLLKSFLMGGAISTLGHIINNVYIHFGAVKDTAAGFTSITLIFLGALLTGLGIYDNLAEIGCAGTLIPITGFANSVVAPAMEFKSEGHVAGISVKLFTISGPVILFGAMTATVYGVVYCLFR